MAGTLDGEALVALLRMSGDDADFVGEVMDEFVVDARRHLTAMRGAIDSDAPHDLARAGHTLKGTSLSVGAAQLAETCRQIEHLARTEELPGLLSLVARAEAELVEVTEALDVARRAGWQVDG